MTSGTRSQFEFTKLPSFPGTLFAFRQYDGGRTIAAILLVIATIYFSTGFWGFLIEHNAWLHDFIYPISRGTEQLSNAWWDPLGVFHPVVQVLAHIPSYIDIAFRLFIFLCAFCLAWGTFDPKNIEGYAMGLFNTFLGAAYVLAPVDLIPDSVPMVGSIDDSILGVGMVALGVSGWCRTYMRDARTKTVLDLVDHGNTERALQLLLEDKGVSIKSRE